MKAHARFQRLRSVSRFGMLLLSMPTATACAVAEPTPQTSDATAHGIPERGSHPDAGHEETKDPSDGEVLPACNACMHHLAQSCTYMARVPIVAIVEGARTVTSEVECEAAGQPNDSRRCYSFVSYQFESIHFLRNASGGTQSDRFASWFEFEYDEKEREGGILLAEDKRYRVFASLASPAVTPEAQWFITSACEIPSDEIASDSD